ncbi:MAG TPA: DUF167 domain-containing protein [Pyrinomonadaceae bacterium]|jgi:hypothetical protein
MIQFSEQNGAIVFTVRVVPRASKSEIVGAYDSLLKIRLAAPPVEGAANEELIKTLAKYFDVSKSAVEIVSGATAKTKQIRVTGANAEKLRQI